MRWKDNTIIKCKKPSPYDVTTTSKTELIYWEQLKRTICRTCIYPGFLVGLVSFMCMFCRSLFVLLSLWPLCCLFFFDIRILITHLVSLNSSPINQFLRFLEYGAKLALFHYIRYRESDDWLHVTVHLKQYILTSKYHHDLYFLDMVLVLFEGVTDS